jgi:hypothetical protein
MQSQNTPESTPADTAAGLVPIKKSNLRRNVLIAGSAVGLIGIGSTLASNITINAGESVEFGQGVAETTTCDTDITITPVTSYDIDNSIFRLDRVEVSNLDLTPVGTGWDDSDLNGLYADQAAAKAARPGEYFDGTANQWKRTCDGVVLDFKAYTDDADYWTSTREGYSNNATNDISTPVGWAQYDGNPTQITNTGILNFGFSVIFDVADDGSSFNDNYGAGTDSGGPDGWANLDYTMWDDVDRSTPANSSFSFGSMNTYVFENNIADYRPDAASISKITVASMKTFPTNYYIDNDSGIGTGD